MNNVQLARFVHERGLSMKVFFEMVEHWYEWCFREELLERCIKGGGYRG